MFYASQSQPAVKRSQTGSNGFVQIAELFRQFGRSCDQKSCQGIIMPAQIFCAAVYDNIGAQVKGILKVRSHKGIVYDKNGSVSVGHIGSLSDVRGMHHRIRGRFQIEGLRCRGEMLFQIFCAGGIEKLEVKSVFF